MERHSGQKSSRAVYALVLDLPTSILDPHTTTLYLLTSILDLLTSILDLPTSILDLLSSILDPHTTIYDHLSYNLDPRSSHYNPRSVHVMGANDGTSMRWTLQQSAIYSPQTKGSHLIHSLFLPSNQRSTVAVVFYCFQSLSCGGTNPQQSSTMPD